MTREYTEDEAGHAHSIEWLTEDVLDMYLRKGESAVPRRAKLLHVTDYQSCSYPHFVQHGVIRRSSIPC